MKACFAHDHIFYKDEKDNYYSNGKLPYSIWQRYLSHFDELTIIGRSTQYNSKKNLVLSSGPKVNFQPVPNISNFYSKIKSIKISKNLITTKLKNSDALIVRLPSEIGLLSIKIAEQLDLPWAVEVVGCPLNAYWYHGNFLGKLYAPVVYLKTKMAIAKSKFAIYVTEEYLQRRYPSKGFTAFAANVEINEIESTVLDLKLNYISKSKASYTIGLIGGISTKLKGIDTAINAMKRLRKFDKKFRLEIVGDGDPNIWKDKIINNTLQDYIIFKGTLKKGTELNKWIDSLDIYIQPSLTEGLPRALIEAMSRGCPAIGSKVGGIPELLNAEFIHQPKDHKRLAELIITLTENKELAKQQAIRNFDVAKKFYKNILDKKRDKFWYTFYEYVKSKKSNNLMKG